MSKNEAPQKKLETFPETKGFEAPKKEDVPVQIMTEKDSYLSARIKAQPKKLEDLEVTVRTEKEGIHRLSLPDYFEQFSYDCTRGLSCAHHGWTKSVDHYADGKKIDRYNQTKRGKYIFRWLNSNPKALDPNIDVNGWAIVNKSLFPECPDIHFSISGGVRNGDAILGVMPVAKALDLRLKPARESAQLVKDSENRHEDHPSFYKAKLDSESADADFAPSHAQIEGRDF